ncbi:hypothetical protein ACTXT7_007824 [Hymenolepis weldensis]
MHRCGMSNYRILSTGQFIIFDFAFSLIGVPTPPPPSQEIPYHSFYVFPTRRSVYVEESQQAQYELRSSLSRKDVSGKSEEEKKPPHHYTGPWMFKGLSPRLPPPLERSRERRPTCSASARSPFCPLTVQSENSRSTTKVDRMVSPIPSPPHPAQSSTSIYGTLSRYPRSRHQSGVFAPKQGDLDISIGNGIPNSGYGTWRAPRGHLGLTAEYTGEADERRTSANLGASRISLWNQKITTVEHPEPHRFGSLGRYEDRLIRKYLQRHSSIQGSRCIILVRNNSVVKQGVSDFWYSTIIVSGIAFTGFIFYVIGNELFSSQSPARVYEEALNICVSDHRVQELLGTPITGCGEVNRRGRRTQIASNEWIDTHGKKHLVMRFYLKGVYASGTVHLELYESDFKEMVYRYLVVEVDGLTRHQVILRPEEKNPTLSYSVQPPALPPAKLEPFNKESG